MSLAAMLGSSSKPEAATATAASFESLATVESAQPDISAPQQRAPQAEASKDNANHAEQEELRAVIVSTSKKMVDTSTSSHARCITFYHIKLSDPAESRTFMKRYSDFKAFDRTLRKSQPALDKTMPKLPKSGMFGLRHSLGLESFERKRKDGLQAYLDVAAAELDGATFRGFFEAQHVSASRPACSAGPPADAGDDESFVSATSGSEWDGGANAEEAGASGVAVGGEEPATAGSPTTGVLAS